MSGSGSEPFVDRGCESRVESIGVELIEVQHHTAMSYTPCGQWR